MPEIEDRILDLSEKVYKNSASPEEKKELFELLRQLIAEQKEVLDKAKKK